MILRPTALYSDYQQREEQNLYFALGQRLYKIRDQVLCVLYADGEA